MHRGGEKIHVACGTWPLATAPVSCFDSEDVRLRDVKGWVYVVQPSADAQGCNSSRDRLQKGRQASARLATARYAVTTLG